MTNDPLFKPFVTVAAQSLHMLEHIVQVIKKFVLQLAAAHGILEASLNFERVHFAFNILYLGLVAVVWIIFTKTPIRKMNLEFHRIL